MEPFIVSARKYRPQQFEDVVGQQAITKTLENAIANNHLAQALLFCGPRGVGKTTCARILARKINEDGTQREGEDFAFNIFELDAASNNSVDDIRNLIDQVRIPPQVGKYKVYIIDEVHMLSQSAFNAFLKTLEEPPKHAIFILATTEKHKIIPTILSRCQIFDFRRITVKDAADYLGYIAKEQGIEAEEDALHIIAQKADGALRDALSIFDRVVSYSGKTLTRKEVTENLNVLDYETYLRMTDLILEQNIPQLLLELNDLLAKGFEGHHFISGLASHFRDLLVCKHESTMGLLEVSEQAKAQYAAQAEKAPEPLLIKALELANSADLNYKTSRNHRLLVELTLMKMASLGNSELKKKVVEFEVELLPASHFVSQFAQKPADSTEVIVETANSVAPEIQDPPPEENAQSPTEEELEVAPPTISIENRTEKVSGLSLSSIRIKKEHRSQKSKQTDLSAEELPQDDFTEEQLWTVWQRYVAKIEAQGRKILASGLMTDKPKVTDQGDIGLELPNATMKKEIETEQHALLQYVREALNNYSISLKITVNEESARQYAFTPEEKYQKLREKNPAIDHLRKTFDLDL